MLLGVAGIAFIALASGCTTLLRYSVPLANAPEWIARWDANGDGRSDLVMSHASGTNLDFFPMGEHGMVSRSPVASPLAGVRIGGLAVGDFGPGHIDQLAVLDVSRPTQERVLFYSRLGGSTTPVAQVQLEDVGAVAVSAGDVNRDGYDDLAISVRKPNIGFGCITDGCVLFVLGGAGGPTLSPLSVSAGPVEGRRYDPAQPAILDANGDGTADLLIPDTATNEIVLVPGAGRGAFDQNATSVLIKTPQPPINVAVQDANLTQVVYAVFAPGSGANAFGRWLRDTPTSAFGAPSMYPTFGAFQQTVGSTYFGAKILGHTEVAQRIGDGCASIGNGASLSFEQACRTSYVYQDGSASDAADPPRQVDFGDVRVGVTKTVTFSFPVSFNSRWESVKVDPYPTVSGPFALQDVRVQGPDTSLGSCPSVDGCTIRVSFAPTASGAATGSVRLETFGLANGGGGADGFIGGPVTIQFRGVGVVSGGGTNQVGFADDASKYADDGGKAVYADMKTLGAKVNRWTLAWEPTNPEREFPFLDRAVPAAQKAGIDIIVSAFPAKASNTGDPAGFCSWLKGVAVRYPYLRRFIIGNEVNATRFWSPQHITGDADAGPRSYYAALSRCYDALKSVSTSIQVIGMGLAPRSVDASSTKPLAFVRAVGKIYKQDTARGATPIMDAIAVHPYPNPNVSPPPAPDNAKYEDPDYYGIPQLDRVRQAVWDAFHGTAQKTTVDGLPIVIDELGYQTDTSGKPLYTGSESSPIVAEDTQAQYYARIIGLYGCDPSVSDVLLFHLIDETQRNPDSNAGGWQSGIEYPDAGRKPSFASVENAIGLGCTGAKASWKPAGATGATSSAASTAAPLALTSPAARSPIALVQDADGSLTWEADASAPSALSVAWAVRRDSSTKPVAVKATKAIAFGQPIALTVDGDLDPGHYFGTVTLSGAGGATSFAIDFVVAGTFSSTPKRSPLVGVRAGDGALRWTFPETVPEAAKVTAHVLRAGRPVLSAAVPALRDGDPVVLPLLGALDPGVYTVRFLVRSTKNPARGVDYVTPAFTVVSAATPGGVTWKRSAQGAPFWSTGTVAPKGGADLVVSWGAGSAKTRLAAGDPVSFFLDTSSLKAGRYSLGVTISAPAGAARPLGAAIQLKLP